MFRLKMQLCKQLVFMQSFVINIKRLTQNKNSTMLQLNRADIGYSLQ